MYASIFKGSRGEYSGSLASFWGVLNYMHIVDEGYFDDSVCIGVLI